MFKRFQISVDVQIVSNHLRQKHRIPTTAQKDSFPDHVITASSHHKKPRRVLVVVAHSATSASIWANASK